MGSAEADMDAEREESANAAEQSGPVWRWFKRIMLALVLIALGVLAYLWLTREQIAGDVIDDALAQNELEASYEIASIGPQRQIIENLVIGAPDAPDLTVERVIVDIAYGLSAPQIGQVTLERPRLYGTYRDGVLSLGALDDVLFAESDEPVGLPAIDVAIVGGGALLETDYGDIGASFSGEGPLDSEFLGKLAITAPGAGRDGCKTDKATAYGEFALLKGAPRFEGPVRFRGLACEGAKVEALDALTTISSDADFASIKAIAEFEAASLAYPDVSSQGAAGTVRAAFSKGDVTLDHDVTLTAVSSPYGGLSSVNADGAWRSAENFSRSDWSARVEGEGGDFGRALGQSLEDAVIASEGTLAAPLLAKFSKAFASAAEESAITADVTYRVADGAQTLVVPEARLRGATGETILALSRVSWSVAGAGQAARLRGNFLTGGEGIPQINGRMERVGSGPLGLRMAMAEYAAGDSLIAIPNLSLRQTPSGTYTFAGLVKASGAIPGGSISGLEVPINGQLTARGGLSIAAQCETVRFASLKTYNLTLAGQSARLCPIAGRPILAYSDTLRIGAQTGNVSLTGAISGAATKLAAASASFQYPGGFTLTEVAATIGEQDNAVALTAAELKGDIGETYAGTFASGTARIDAVPLDLSELVGNWSYADDTLTISDARFLLTERIEGRARFEPLISEGARLTLADGAISANASLDLQTTGDPIADVVIGHDLSSGNGNARLGVDRLTFGPDFGLDDLTYLAKGVIAYTKGSVTGEGRFAWTADDVTSDGEFKTDNLDLATAFGPIEGLKGKVRFDDLLNLTTAPEQEIEIASINPGIEVIGGKVRFSMTDGEIIDIGGGRWPFMGGELIMRPTKVKYGSDEDQRYIFEVVALDAAKFVAQMELSNIGATGIFDGTIGVNFDPVGNGRIEEGLLISRAPGGNISYIGELTYEDLGAISNYAFQSLRSLDYRQMSVSLEGDLAGEILTKFSIDGVRQGEDASQNFITRRLAKLPIRFIVNVRSENFYELATMVRTFWDPEALPGAEATGLIPPRLMPSAPTPAPSQEERERPIGMSETTSEALRPKEPASEPTVQPPESEPVP